MFILHTKKDQKRRFRNTFMRHYHTEYDSQVLMMIYVETVESRKDYLFNSVYGIILHPCSTVCVHKMLTKCLTWQLCKLKKF